jgi:hypothetical protein
VAPDVERMARMPRRVQHVVGEAGPCAHERFDEAPIGALVLAESPGRLVEAPMEKDRFLSIERMSERHLGMNPLQTMLGEGQGGEERRPDPERIDR